MEHIYNTLMSFVLPWAIENSNLCEDEVQDYIHDFYLDLIDNRKQADFFDVVKSDKIIKNGRYDLEHLRDPTKLSRFFFQYVTRENYKEGQWVDRRLQGRRTQQEHILGHDLTPCLPSPKNSYEMHLQTDSVKFVETLSELELKVLFQRLTGEEIKTLKLYNKKKYYRTLKSLQKKWLLFFSL